MMFNFKNKSGVNVVELRNGLDQNLRLLRNGLPRKHLPHSHIWHIEISRVFNYVVQKSTAIQLAF